MEKSGFQEETLKKCTNFLILVEIPGGNLSKKFTKETEGKYGEKNRNHIRHSRAAAS